MKNKIIFPQIGYVIKPVDYKQNEYCYEKEGGRLSDLWTEYVGNIADIESVKILSIKGGE